MQKDPSNRNFTLLLGLKNHFGEKNFFVERFKKKLFKKNLNGPGEREER